MLPASGSTSITRAIARGSSEYWRWCQVSWWPNGTPYAAWLSSGKVWRKVSQSMSGSYDPCPDS